MLVANQQTIELGKIKFGKPYNFTYNLTNDGTETVSVRRLAAGCSSCTKAAISTNKIAAGQQALVSVSFTPNSLGEQRRVVTVEFSNNQTLRLEFIANVQ